MMGYRPTIKMRRTTACNRKSKIKAELLVRSPHCHWCGRDLSPDEATLDHRVPRSLGGSNGRGNLVLACAPCNQAKGAMMPHQFWVALASGAIAVKRAHAEPKEGR
jgi:5-methylcytosine-specific restriction endonuclease McrA